MARLTTTIFVGWWSSYVFSLHTAVLYVLELLHSWLDRDWIWDWTERCANTNMLLGYQYQIETWYYTAERIIQAMLPLCCKQINLVAINVLSGRQVTTEIILVLMCSCRIVLVRWVQYGQNAGIDLQSNNLLFLLEKTRTHLFYTEIFPE